MRSVLYATDLEPITVLELTGLAADYLRDRRFVRLLLPFKAQSYDSLTASTTVKTVDIWAEPLRRGSHESLLLFTADDTDALLLKTAFLPGQHKGVQQRERAAFAEGFCRAINMIGR